MERMKQIRSYLEEEGAAAVRGSSLGVSSRLGLAREYSSEVARGKDRGEGQR